MEVRAVLFDLDGTLVDTEHFHTQGWIDTLNQYGVTLDVSEYFGTFMGKPGEEIDKLMRTEYNLDLPPGTILEKKDKITLQKMKTKGVTCLPFAKEAIQKCISKGWKICVGSNSPMIEIKVKLESSKLNKYFDTIISSDEVENPKPSPDLYLALAKAVDIHIDNCVAIEDTLTGVRAAKAAKIKCLVVPTGASKQQNFSEADGTFSTILEAVDSL